MEIAERETALFREDMQALNVIPPREYIGAVESIPSVANHVERIVRKAAAASLLSGRIGADFDAIVTGVNREGTYVRLISPPAEGRVMRGQEGMDVGERVRVRLVSTNERKGHIDFEGIR